MDPCVIDTDVFSVVPASWWREHAAGTRPGNRLIDLPGCSLRIRDSAHEPAPGAPDRAVVLVVDAPHTVECYDDLVAGLASDVRLIVVEPPGFGFSWVSDPARLDLDQGADAVLAVLRQLRVPRVVLAGACVSGYLALAAAHAAPDLVDGILLAQTPSWRAARHWGRSVLDPHGHLATPWEGQARWRRGRVATADQWYATAAGPHAPLEAWQRHARTALEAGASYALASQLQRWWGDQGAEPPAATDLPAVVLWGEADRSHRSAATDPSETLELVPRARLVRLPEVGHFADTEDPDATREAVLSLL